MTEGRHTQGRWKFERMESAEEFVKLKGETLAEHEGYYRDNNGDWIVGFSNEGADEDDMDIGGRIAAVSFKGSAKRGQTWNAPDPEGQANARLIAAAPDLLAALKAITSPTGFRDLDVGGNGTHGAALAAIAKAEGRS